MDPCQNSSPASALSAASEAGGPADVVTVPPASDKRPKKRVESAVMTTPVAKKRKNASGSAVSETKLFGVVDPESDIEGSIEILDNSPCDVMLVLVTPQKHTDNFFILQLIRSSEGTYIVHTRRGLTGTSGRILEKEFDSYDDAVRYFENKFQEKTGLAWRGRTDPNVEGKFRFIQQNFEEKLLGYTRAKWQYWVDDGVDGKTRGWHDYTATGSVVVERLFQENLINLSLSNRMVENGVYAYNVDFSTMTQTNITHSNRTIRRIRRCPEGEDIDVGLPIVTPSKLSASLCPNSSLGSLVIPTLVTTRDSLPAEKSSSKNSGPPVDPDLDINHKGFSVVMDVENDEWCDVVLNQCNITGGSNNNKYYRLQLLQKESTGQFWAWFKWGRVGSWNQNALKGPFVTFEAGLKVFAKKYKDKTKNRWGSKEFVQAKRKYTRIQVDNKVSMRQEMNGMSLMLDDVECLSLKMDAKVKELMEVLFTKGSRNEGLTAFSVDHACLPLGIPSEQQIQVGISILNQIVEKLGGGDVSDSYQELSSRFYTSIPHSFGYTRPSVIDNQTSLQQRYEVCEILIDIYSQNEAIRKLSTRRTVSQCKSKASPEIITILE